MKYILIIIFLAGCLIAADSPDAKLISLQKALKEAQSQGEQNLASGNLTAYWRAELQKEEGRILKLSSPANAALFIKAQKAWHEFAEAEIHYISDGYQGGSIQPLIINTTNSRLIEDRIKQLRLYPENK
jgi:uncharacterized protein YecT (DUF1311 family)